MTNNMMWVFPIELGIDLPIYSLFPNLWPWNDGEEAIFKFLNQSFFQVIMP